VCVSGEESAILRERFGERDSERERERERDSERFGERERERERARCGRVPLRHLLQVHLLEEDEERPFGLDVEEDDGVALVFFFGVALVCESDAMGESWSS